MDRQRWKKIDSILDKALALDNTEERRTFISKRCKNDEQLHQEIVSLLGYIEKADKENFLLED